MRAVGFLLGLPIAVVTWWLLAFLPFTILSSLFGPHSDVTQGVGACGFFVIGPVCAVAALVKCTSIDFDRAGRPSGAAGALLTVVRLPFVSVAISLWIVIAIPCLVIAVAVCYIAILVLAIAATLALPFVLFYAAIIDHTYVSRYFTSFSASMRQIFTQAEQMRRAMWDSPRKLLLWWKGSDEEA